MRGVGGRMREGWRVWVDCHTQCFFSWQLDGVCVEVAKEGVVHWVGELRDADFTAGGWEGDITHTHKHTGTQTHFLSASVQWPCWNMERKCSHLMEEHT